MYQTVIADDDFLVRTYLKQLDAWKRAGYEIVADVRDGEEALRTIEEIHPEVVVTDITMPLMDGIELIRHIRQMDRDIFIIVLSCHDDFNYVKEAMKLGANEYVLKNSLDEESLFELLMNAKNQMAGLKIKSNEHERNRKLIQMGSHSLKYHFFNRLLSGSLSLEEREQKRQEAGITGRFINSAVVNMFIPKWGEIKSQITPVEAEQYSQLFLHNLTEQLDTLLGAESCYVEKIYLGEGIFCCFIDLSTMCRSSQMRQKLTSVASACFRCCKQEPYQYAAGVSNICIGEDGIRQAYQQAREILKLWFYEGEEILYFDTQKNIGKRMPQEADELKENIVLYVSEKSKSKMMEGFEQTIEACRRNCVDSKLVLHWLKELDVKVKVERTPEEYARIIKIEQLLEIGNEYADKLFLVSKKELPQGVSAAIKQSVKFIHEHYKNQIGLTDAAEAAGLNPAYLSYLFKQEMGIGFSNYLLECRMDCAKELLKNTTFKVKDVAMKSGFNDYHYFSKAFKKLVGCNPAEYRNDD